MHTDTRKHACAGHYLDATKDAVGCDPRFLEITCIRTVGSQLDGLSGWKLRIFRSHAFRGNNAVLTGTGQRPRVLCL